MRSRVDFKNQFHSQTTLEDSKRQKLLTLERSQMCLSASSCLLWIRHVHLITRGQCMISSPTRLKLSRLKKDSLNTHSSDMSHRQNTWNGLSTRSSKAAYQTETLFKATLTCLQPLRTSPATLEVRSTNCVQEKDRMWSK